MQTYFREASNRMRKKILLISPVPTHPQTAGNRARVCTLLSNINEMKHDVFFLHIKREPGDEKSMRDHWGDRYYSISYQMPKKSTRQKIVRKLRSFCDKEAVFTHSIDDWYDTSLDRSILKLSRQIEFDAVIVEYVFFSKALTCFGPKVLKAIDTHDVFTNRHSTYLKNRVRPMWYSTTAREEAKGLNRADVIIAIQEKEKDIFCTLTNKQVITIGHIAPLYAPMKDAPGTGTILYVGSANPINTEAINYFIKDILPRVRQAFPSAQLLLAGRVCDTLDNSDNFIKLGELEDLKVAYDMADIVVNPIPFGTGLKIKNMEALGHSKPLVTTSIGADGLKNGVGKAFLVADTAHDFARSVVEILSDSELFRSLSQNAYHFARRYNQENLNELSNILDF